MTTIVATATAIWVDKRITLKDSLIDASEAQHAVRATLTDFSKVYSCETSDSEYGEFKRAVGYGEIRVSRYLVELIRAVGMTGLVQCIPTLNRWIRPCVNETGLVMVNTEGQIYSITVLDNDITVKLHTNSMVAFGSGTRLFDYFNNLKGLMAEEAFFMACDTDELSSSNEYDIYRVQTDELLTIRYTSEQLQERRSEIRQKIAQGWDICIPN